MSLPALPLGCYVAARHRTQTERAELRKIHAQLRLAEYGEPIYYPPGDPNNGADILADYAAAIALRKSARKQTV